MIVILKGFIWEIDIGIGKYSNFESRQFQSISATFSDWGSLCSAQSESSDWYQVCHVCMIRPVTVFSYLFLPVRLSYMLMGAVDFGRRSCCKRSFIIIAVLLRIRMAHTTIIRMWECSEVTALLVP